MKTSPDALAVPGLSWAAASQPFNGGSCSGDLFAVRPTAEGATIAVADGLGHGPGAHDAAARAMQAIVERPAAPLPELFEFCHGRLRSTRGAALSVVQVDMRARRLAWFGVGNVEAGLLRSAPLTGPRIERIRLRPGIVGFDLPRVNPSVLSVCPGDWLVFGTDGVAWDVEPDMLPDDGPETFASRILARSQAARDDALVLAVRFVKR